MAPAERNMELLDYPNELVKSVRIKKIPNKFGNYGC